MKKFFALLALAALLLTAFAFPVLAEEPILGGWSAYTDNPTEIPTEALDALNAAHAAGFDVVACGDGPLEEKFCAAMRAGDRYLGRISGTDAMKAFYADCDVLLVPSSAETFGMVYLEAMSQGVPVLYTKGQGFDGQFPEGEIGYAVPCGDVQAQTEALKQVTQGYAQRSRRCVAGAEKYAWPRIAGMWMRLYREICIEKRGV